MYDTFYLCVHDFQELNRWNILWFVGLSVQDLWRWKASIFFLYKLLDNGEFWKNSYVCCSFIFSCLSAGVLSIEHLETHCFFDPAYINMNHFRVKWILIVRCQDLLNYFLIEFLGKISAEPLNSWGMRKCKHLWNLLNSWGMRKCQYLWILDVHHHPVIERRLAGFPTNSWTFRRHGQHLDCLIPEKMNLASWY